MEQIFAQIAEFCGDAWRMGWHERNGGNVSLCVDIEATPSGQAIPLTAPVVGLENAAFVVSTAGSYFKNIAKDPQKYLCIIKINATADGYYLISGDKPTSELQCHLLCHQAKGERGVVYHAHPPALTALSFVLPPESRAFSEVLWQSLSETAMVVPEGFGVLPWILPGSHELAVKTAQFMQKYNIIIWANHGATVFGSDLDDTFSLLETAEKSADICLKYQLSPKYPISQDSLEQLAALGGKRLNSEWN